MLIDALMSYSSLSPLASNIYVDGCLNVLFRARMPEAGGRGIELAPPQRGNLIGGGGAVRGAGGNAPW